MHIAEVVTIAKSLPLLRLNTYKSLILSYSADYRRILEKKLNIGLKNGSFEEKRKAYALSSYIDAQMIAGYNEWNENKIVNRQIKMAHVAVNIWRI